MLPSQEYVSRNDVMLLILSWREREIGREEIEEGRCLAIVTVQYWLYPSDVSSTGKPIKLSSKAYLIPSLPGVVIQHLIMQSRPTCNGKHPRLDDITAVGSSHAKATVRVLLNRADETNHCQLPIVQLLIEQLLIEQLLIEQLLIEQLLIEKLLIEQLLI